MDDIIYEVGMFNKVWTFKGMNAINDLIGFLDEHCSDAHASGVRREDYPPALIAPDVGVEVPGGN